MRKIYKLQAFLLLAIGIAISAFPIILMNDFIRVARPIILMGSRLQPNSAVTESVIATVLLLFLFLVGAALIVIAVKRILKTSKK